MTMKFFLAASLLLLSFIGTKAYTKPTMCVSCEFKSNKIVPDIVDSAPKDFIEISYESGVKAELGNELTPTQVKDQPIVSYKADTESFYALVFADADNYEDPIPENREYQHWLVVNIPGCNVEEGEVMSEYIGSGPLEGTGLHRYIYTLFKQPEKLYFEEKKLDNKSIDGRAAFSTKKFAEKYNLGRPVAGNFYHAQFDDYVPELYESLGLNIA